MPKKTNIPKLTDAELEILHLGVDDPRIITQYFLRKETSENGFVFDSHFTEEGAWQLEYCKATQTMRNVVGGVATGKTVGMIVSNFVYAMTTPDFRFLNIAKEQYQATFAYKEIMGLIEGTPAERLVFKSREMPRPFLELKFYAGKQLMHATFEFVGLGDDGDAKQLLSWRGDFINIEEAGRVENLADIVGVLQTRLTGSINGRSFMGVMSLISNPLDNPDLWTFFDMATADPENVLSIAVSTYDNKNVTDKQIEMMLKNIPEKDRERYITGSRTETEGGWFSKKYTKMCQSPELSELILDNERRGEDGYYTNGTEFLGWLEFRTPSMPSHDYIVIGDPGIGNAPSRNAPVVQVWDATPFSNGVPGAYAQLVAMWWGRGGGSITPFVDKMLDYIDKYHPVYAGVDNTATQKNTAEMVNLDRVEGKGYSVEGISGLDFSSGRKFSYLVSLRFMLENLRLRWPNKVKGFSQIISYDPAKDSSGPGGSKIAQDIVAAAAMASFVIRALFMRNDNQGESEDERAEREKFRNSIANSIETARKNISALRSSRASGVGRQNRKRSSRIRG